MPALPLTRILRQIRSRIGSTDVSLSRLASKERPRVGGRNRRTLLLESLESRRVFAGDAFYGIYQSGNWKLSDVPSDSISFGLPGDQPVMGDWNGDGQKTPGIYRNGTWVLDLSGNGFDSNDRVLSFGLPGDQAVAGDWDGDGIDTVGVYRNGVWHFDRNGNGFDAADGNPVAFGLPGDIAVAGDWNGDRIDTPGIYRAGTWALDLTGNGFDGGDRFLQFGLPGDQPVAGDWNGDGRDTPGVLQNGHWFFDLEGNGFNGEIGKPNTLGQGIAVSGSRPARPEVDVVDIVDGQTAKVSFGTTSVGTPVSQTFTVRNLGTATLNLGSVQVPTGFTLLQGLPASLVPNGSASFRVQMDAAQSGSRSGTIQFSSNDLTESIYNFEVVGTVDIPITPTPVSPEVNVVGVTSGQAAPVSMGTVGLRATVMRSFTVENLGTGTLNLSGLTANGAIRIVQGLPTSLAPRSATTFTIALDTLTTGTKSGSIQFNSNDADEGTYRFNITGVVQAETVPSGPEVNVVGVTSGQATSVSFGTVRQGTIATQDFTVQNLGDAPLTLGRITVPTGFTLTKDLPRTLAAKASATFQLRMNTASVSSPAGTVSFATNDADEPTYAFRVAGSVTATPSPKLEVVGITNGQAAPISFGTVNVGDVATRTFTVRNTGTATLTLGQVQVPTGFTVTNGLPSSLAANASTTFTVAMNTTSSGSRSGMIRFTSSDVNQQTFIIPVQGTVQSITSNFGAVVAHQTIAGPQGILVLKTVRVAGAAGNNLRLYGDFLNTNGSAHRRDVRIGDFAAGIHDVKTPMVTLLGSGRYAIAWASTNITTAGGIHFAIHDAFGGTIRQDAIANINYTPNPTLQSITTLSNGGFRITWHNPITNQTLRRDFTMLGTGTTGEVRV